MKEAVAIEEAQVKIQAAETQVIKDDAQKELDVAMPALNAAIDALNSLNKADITEMKSFIKPPPLVLMTMEAISILLGEPIGWDSAKKVNFTNTYVFYHLKDLQSLMWGARK